MLPYWGMARKLVLALLGIIRSRTYDIRVASAVFICLSRLDSALYVTFRGAWEPPKKSRLNLYRRTPHL